MDMIICSNTEQLTNLKDRCSHNYVAATSKYSFYAACKKAAEPIVYLEPDELSNFDEVINIIDEIMRIIENCDVQKSYLYRVSYHIEGGFPSTIDMMLQNIRLLKKIIDEYRINRIYLCDDKDNWKVNEAVFVLAQSAHIEYQIIDEYGEKEREVLFTLRRSKYNPNVKKSEFESQEHQNELTKYFQRKNNTKKNKSDSDIEIGFLYAAVNNGKHFKWTMNELRIFADRFKVGVISFYHSEDNECFRSHNIDVECLEDYFDKELFEENYEVYLRDSRCIADKLTCCAR